MNQRTEGQPETEALIAAFEKEYPFPLDPFQREAIAHLAEGRSVLVAAPTGTGKTVVAEFGIWLARNQGKRVIYTAPLKALSNQKFRDLRARYGPQAVGLVTGDIVEANQAPIVVMTTEIYRNMLLEEEARSEGTGARGEAESAETRLPASEAQPSENAGTRLPARAAPRSRPQAPVAIDNEPAWHIDEAAVEEAPAADEPEASGSQWLQENQPAPVYRFNAELADVACVVFDELHYLSDPERGPVWEEAIIHSPQHIALVGLSATVSNADEVALWMSRVHRPINLVFHTERAVPLEHYYYLDGKLHLAMAASGKRVQRFPKIGGEAKRRRERGESRMYSFSGENGKRRQPAVSDVPIQGAASQPGQPAQASRPSSEREAPQPGEILTALREANLLPSLYFLPGRRIVEESALSAAGHLFTSPEEHAQLQEEVNAWLSALPPEDRELEQVQRLTALLPRGLAYHHAGLLPGLKVLVETLFQRGHLRAVFATDTLALGINMPARSVVVGSLTKFDGTEMRLLTPNEYQQLTGRAGRRGMDERGAAVIPYSPWDAFEPAFAALTGELLPVQSAFIIRYNSVLNLWRGGDLKRLRRDVASSFREFQRYSYRLLQEQQETRQESTPMDEDMLQAVADYAAQSRRSRRERERPITQRERHRALSRAAAAELNGTIDVLRGLEYIDHDDQLTVKGRLLRRIFHPAGIMWAELIENVALDELHPSEMAELASWFAFDDDRPVRNRNILSHRLNMLRREVFRVTTRVQMTEIDEGIEVSPGINADFHGVALNWWRGSSLAALQRRIDLAEGDLLVILNQTIDQLQQVQGAVGQILDDRTIWQPRNYRSEEGRIREQWLQAARQRLERIRPILGMASKGLLRGIVLQSRTVPSMAVQVGEESVPLDMEEDEDRPDLRVDIPEAYQQQ